MVAEEGFFELLQFYSYYLSQKGNFQGTAGAAIRICGSVEPEPIELFSAQQHCRRAVLWNRNRNRRNRNFLTSGTGTVTC